MKIPKLYTYKSENLELFKDRLEKSGSLVLNLSQITTLIEEEEGKNIYLDITSVIHMLETNKSKEIEFEGYFNDLPTNITVIVREDLIKYIKESLPYSFSEIIEIEPIKRRGRKKAIVDNSKLKIIDFDKNNVDNFFLNFDKKLFGHVEFKAQFQKNIKSFRIFNKMGEHKIFSLFLFGLSGIGKTQVGRIIHSQLAPNEPMIKINFGNYSDQNALSSLIGSPRGYFGSETGELKEKIDNSKSGVIIIDEFEKADLRLHNFFLELLEDGKFTDSLGRTTNLNGYIIVFTSNIQKEKYEQIVSPELRSRFDCVAYFNELSIVDKDNYVKYYANNMISKYNETFRSHLILSDEKASILNIDVSKYKNLRQLNTEIKSRFLKIVESKGIY